MRKKQLGIVLLACLVLVVVTCMPVCAGDINTQIADSELAIRKAHLTWVSGTKEAEMNAAIAYVGTLYGADTGQMNRIYSDFRTKEIQIPRLSTKNDLDLLIMELRNVTRQFREETTVQMAKGQGKAGDLQGRLSAATAQNPYIEMNRKNYWDTRAATQSADFRNRLDHAQTFLNTLKTGGYDTAKAQRTLDVISSKQPELQAALEAKSDEKIRTVNGEIYDLSIQLTRQVRDSRGQVSKDKIILFFIEQGYRAVAQADKINNDLIMAILDIGPAEPILAKIKKDLYDTKSVLNSGRIEAAATSLQLVKKDFKDLALAYREIAHSANLPGNTADTLNSMALSLDDAADQMEGL